MFLPITRKKKISIKDHEIEYLLYITSHNDDSKVRDDDTLRRIETGQLVNNKKVIRSASIILGVDTKSTFINLKIDENTRKNIAAGGTRTHIS